MTDRDTTANPQTASAPIAAIRNITKRFPGVIANEGISLEFRAGEIHVLLGENGAGKSTLIGILAGMQQPDEGEILIAGRSVVIGSPRESLDLGIGTVFQHVLLVPSLTVIENLMLGGPWWQRLSKASALKRLRELSTLLGVEIDPDALVGRLSLGEQQQIEIMRALWRGEKVLILDEPTSMLTPQGVHDLGQVMRRLREKGVALILVTHKLKEAYELGDRISVLRLGRLVGDIPPQRLKQMSEADMTDTVIRMMFGTSAEHTRDAETLVGHERQTHRDREIDRHGSPRLIVTGLQTEANLGECPLREVSFELWPGEVLGIAGVDGNGQKHLAEVLAGQRHVTHGRIALGDADITTEGVPARRRLGVRYVTDERLGEGTVGSFSVATNLVLKEIGNQPYWRRGISDWNLIHSHAREQIRHHDIRTPSEKTPVARLSGGNIQKVLLARELNTEASVVIFNKPTYGLDLQNTRLAHDRIIASAKRGLAVIVVSTDLDELLQISDRIGVMFQGRLTGTVENGLDVERKVGLLMTGAEAA
ncbi:MAG: ral nucleoside transport system ATP-binding protein [Rhodospirillaceae bacterium]|nr:ral nucleoside transport system ATP-binding protein [Rhodospirillaceae bacterium]